MPDTVAPHPLLGQAFALAAPICWSVAIILFRLSGRSVPPVALNLFKNSLALVLFTITLLVLGSAPAQGGRSDHVWLLILSGAIGIGLSDTFFFMCLNRVGAGLQAIVNTSYSPVIRWARARIWAAPSRQRAVVMLAHTLTFTWLEAAMARFQPAEAKAGALSDHFATIYRTWAVLAVGWVRDRRAQRRVPHRVSGILYGLAGTVTQGVSIVMVKPVLEENPVVWATWWRLFGGLAVGALIVTASRRQRATLPALRDRRVWPVMIAGASMGTYVSLLFWSGGMKYAQASVAAALNQTATLWTFLLAVIVLKEPTTKRRLAGLALGAVGVFLVTAQTLLAR